MAETQQSLRSLLCTEERDFFIRKNGDKVKIDDLEGKVVGLYFSAHWCPPCRAFTPTLSEVYTKLLDKGGFEIIFVSEDTDEKSFEEYHNTMPWLALPFSDTKAKEKLDQVFEINGIPTLVFLDKECKTISADGVGIIGDYGVKAYPFTKDRLDELKAEEEAVRFSQTLDSLLVSPDRDFVIANGGKKVPVSELTGKTVGLYFSAHWCPPCRQFTPMLVEVYNKLKQKGEAFEIVFLSGDRDQGAFEKYYSSMPWLALPFGDKVKKDLNRYFYVKGIPTLIIIGPDGKTVTTDGRNVVSVHGAKAYPFTDARLVELKKEIEELAEKWPKEVNHSLHEHSLALTRKTMYSCDGCDKEGSAWSFYCKECDFDLHPDCALNDEHSDRNAEQQEGNEASSNENKPAGIVCEGDACRRV